MSRAWNSGPNDDTEQASLTNDETTTESAYDDTLRPRADHRGIPLRARARKVINKLESSVTCETPDELTTFRVLARVRSHGPLDANPDIDGFETEAAWDAVRDVLRRTDKYVGEYPDHVTPAPDAHTYAAIDASECPGSDGD